MNATGPEGDLKVLRHRVEQAIRASRPREQIVALLEELVAKADDNSDASRFARRQLAEVQLESSPWSAALHLRRLLAHSPDDDTAHALMGLCQALQGNHRMAVASFRRAVALSPNNPWYNHNLGHLLDVTLQAPGDAIVYLRKAHRAQPEQEEVGASLAHCLGRLGECAEAITLTRTLLKRHPHHDDLKRLLAWLEEGAPAHRARPSKRATPSVQAVAPMPRRRTRTAEAPRSDEAVLAAQLRRAGATDDEIARATRMWRDYELAAKARMCEVTAAAIDYAIGRVHGVAARQREVAERHGVRAHELAARFRELKGAINLTARDARYL